MKVPNCEQAEVPDRKLGGYLLDHNHPQNGGKAAFYELVGFTAENIHELRRALQQHVSDHDVVKTMTGEFGARYVVEGNMACPNGKQYPIRSVWFISSSENIPKLVTAYPN
jgi:hypothetical protein